MNQTFCKLTSKDLTTRGGYIWRPSEWRTIPEDNRGGRLCSSSYFHFYTSPLLAAFFNCVHSDIADPLLWEVEVRGEICHEFDKSGSTELMLKRELPLPVITTAQRVAVAILFAKVVCKDKKWNKWANRWMDGEDLSRDAACEAEARADRAEAWAAGWAAARAAGWAARAATAEATEAWAARAEKKAAKTAAEAATLAVMWGEAGSESPQKRLITIISEVMDDPRFSA